MVFLARVLGLKFVTLSSLLLANLVISAYPELRSITDFKSGETDNTFVKTCILRFGWSTDFHRCCDWEEILLSA